MKQVEQVEVFEKALLSHTEMCFSVAFALTHNPNRAEDLARRVLTEAWRLRGSADGGHGIKKKLLTALLKGYLNDCLEASAFENEAANAVSTQYALCT
jgi:DNA-directed RNA polymerase specialized sigma24 family protein